MLTLILAAITISIVAVIALKAARSKQRHRDEAQNHLDEQVSSSSLVDGNSFISPFDMSTIKIDRENSRIFVGIDDKIQEYSYEQIQQFDYMIDDCALETIVMQHQIGGMPVIQNILFRAITVEGGAVKPCCSASDATRLALRVTTARATLLVIFYHPSIKQNISLDHIKSQMDGYYGVLKHCLSPHSELDDQTTGAALNVA